MDLKKYTVAELLKTHTAVLNELRDRDILRSANNPTGDYAEWLFCQAFGWDQAANSVKGFDATDAEGIRYQIKGRRLHHLNTSRQLSTIRDMNGYDVLAGVLFDAAFVVSRAALIPSEIVRDRSKFTEHTNSHRFMLRDDIWNADGVVDVTANLQQVASNSDV